MDHTAELHALREQVYGVEGASATPAMISRLAELEERDRDETASGVAGGEERVGQTSGAAAPTPEAQAPADAVEPESVDDRTAPGATTAGRLVRWALSAVGAVALVGIGIAIGASMSAPTATADPAAAQYPELTFPQTVEDAISAEILRDSGIDSGSTRYIATVRDFRIYLAQPEDGDGRCIVTFTSTDNRPWSAGCASGAQEGPAVFGIDEGLEVAIGDPDDSSIDGIPIRLSESVTAYVAR
ncbi:hypothetical protein [uncultured Microbacterium sp.]|uniref:hypothetical protein n=1 Tax=uncultured Microbacterium sp. TaxID=191216 RepID=UPI00260097AA|nr:hypothetical protein [uncultured Microbacterium sp.]